MKVSLTEKLFKREELFAISPDHQRVKGNEPFLFRDVGARFFACDVARFAPKGAVHMFATLA
eukprot:12762519-Ditylum_brightwellii.AAC.1